MGDVIKIIDKSESALKSIFETIVSFSFLIFCIWLSQGSKWWTFVTGLIFLIIFFMRVATVLKLRTNVFKTKKDLLKWATELEWPENNKSINRT